MVYGNGFIYSKPDKVKRVISGDGVRAVGAYMDISIGNAVPTRIKVENNVEGTVEAKDKAVPKNTLVQWFSKGLDVSFSEADSGLAMCAGVDLDSGGIHQKCLIYITTKKDELASVKVIPVIPSGKELLDALNKVTFWKASVLEITEDKDNPGEYFIFTARMKRLIQNCKKNGEWTEADVGEYIQEIHDWTDRLTEVRKNVVEKKAAAFSRNKVINKFKYSKEDCDRCEAIYISDRAYTSIIAEALSRDPLETGGILLGVYEGNKWYVVEATDPGIHTTHSTVHHEMDEKYHNHVYPVTSRLYKHDLVLEGLWHRHPGDFNKFSQDDNRTNDAYAKAIGNGTLSFLLNFTPEAELTCYYLDEKGTGEYYTPKVYIGDKYFRGTDYLELADAKTLKARKEQMQDEIKGVS